MKLCFQRIYTEPLYLLNNYCCLVSSVLISVRIKQLYFFSSKFKMLIRFQIRWKLASTAVLCASKS